jgi:hypothetical protein
MTVRIPKDLPGRCPHCGGSFETGYGKISTEVRGTRGLGIMGQDDRATYYCRECYQLYERVISALRDANFHWLRAGMAEEKKVNL